MKKIIALGIVSTLCSLVSLTCLTITGCSSLTLEGRATAAYGSFVVAEGVGAQIVASPEIPDAVKAQIQAADRQAKPLGDALYAAIIQYRRDPHTASGLDQALSAAQAAISSLDQSTKKGTP